MRGVTPLRTSCLTQYFLRPSASVSTPDCADEAGLSCQGTDSGSGSAGFVAVDLLLNPSHPAFDPAVVVGADCCVRLLVFICFDISLLAACCVTALFPKFRRHPFRKNGEKFIKSHNNVSVFKALVCSRLP